MKRKPWRAGFAFLLFAAALPCEFAAETRWRIDGDGGITWEVQRDAAHQDQIEMSGRKVSVITTYGVNERAALLLRVQLVFPMLRTIPNDTHASLSYTMSEEALPRLFVNGRPVRAETIRRFRHRGLLTIRSALDPRGEVTLVRTLFPSTDKPLVVEKLVFTNGSQRDITVEVEDTTKNVRTNPARGVYGGYVISARAEGGVQTVKAGASASAAVIFSGRTAQEPEPQVDVDREEQARQARVNGFLSELQLETPDPVLNTEFAFAKLRATESIYETKGGLMHGPGGGAYYAAIWANDQAEYANPFFPFLGDATANESAINSFRWFARHMNPDYRPIPSSIIAEGDGFWNGAGDRGDMAMIAYGASRFALAYGDKAAAEQLWPLIEWCLEYCRRKVTPDGVVTSDSDELEGRFPAGKANLNTSSLYYDALNSAVMLGRELGRPRAQMDDYAARATVLRAAIERYFGARVESFDTYRYYDGNTVLRAWICTPLTVGLFERKQGTIEALFSPRLWTADGLASQAGDKTFWDRATLYALRGVLAAGETERAMDFLRRYSERRLLGDHVPYPVEAWPEGNQRHLAAESALYARVYTEGLFGIRPAGLRSFACTPRLPAAWTAMRLNRIHAFGSIFDLIVTRAEGGLRIEVLRGGTAVWSKVAPQGEPLSIHLDR
jgi:hypothetical protein